MQRVSPLKTNPISKILKKGYINLYTELTHNELRAIHYKEKYKADYPSWDETQVLLSKEFRKHFGARGTNILDAGCGNGNFIVDENRDIIDWACGIDLKPEYTEKNVCLDEIKYTSLDAIPYPDYSFDAVLCLWVFEHIEKPLPVLREINRILKPGGLFFFATPNKNFFPLFLNRFVTKSKLTETILQKVYGRKPEDVFKAYYKANSVPTLTQLANEANFVVERLAYNYDPSYISFNNFTYTLSSKLAAFLESRKVYLNSSHIIGVLKNKL
jgi:SAM-dependent methyltransferase